MTTNKIEQFMIVIAVAAATMTGCGKPMTVRDYVNSKLLRGDPGFQATIEAANIAQAAFNLNADTPIMEAKEDPDTFAKLADMLSKSRDTYRRARSYRIESASSILEPAKDGVRLTDLHAPNVERVPIPGMEITFRVDAGRDRIIVRQVESARGLPIIRFDAWMKPNIAREFYPFLVGDQIEVGGDIRTKIRRIPLPDAQR